MGLLVIVGVVACYVGWHFSKAHMSHRGIPIRQRQLRAFRRVRTHHLIWFLGVGIVFLLIYVLVIAALH